MNTEKKSKQFSIRITNDLYQKIEQEAAEQKRKPASLATIILEDYFETKERFKKIAEKK